ncbi:MAG: DegV family EDD domain-containing protein [Candidatus Aminicenantes bacterium]|nr:DegV family EDD domain-containing protein [Candidatus Aminicenantes bacterium]
MKEIDAAKFKEIVKHGMEFLFQDRALLNRINVFPVPDGDTGDNLVFTLRPLYDEIDALDEPRLDDLAARLAARMLISAKGNSGVIFSQFFFSFAKALKGHAAIGPADFSLAMEKAVRETYESVADPREGTILTVLRHSAEEFKRLALDGELFHVIFEKVIVKAREIVEKTRELLPQLKKARVVDAGGLGFYLFFKGMASAVNPRSTAAAAGGAEAFDRVPLTVDAARLSYCAEWVLRPDGGDRDFFKDILRGHGDSLLIAGDADMLHLHIHTDNPEAVERELARHGRVLSRKVDSLQRHGREVPDVPVALAMDSAVDIPEAVEVTLAVTVIPLQIMLNDRFFRDKFEIGKEELYRRMRREKDLVVKTSQPSPFDFKTAFETALACKGQVLFFSLSSLLSGSHQNALAALRLLPDAARGRVRVIDTRNVSAGSGLLLLHALQLLGRGYGVEEAAAAAENVRDEVASLGYVESLEYAVRGGRLPPAAGWVTRVLGIQPLVAFEKGKLVRKGFLLGTRNKEKKVVRRFLRRLDLKRSYSLGIVYTDNPHAALRLQDELSRSPLKISNVFQAVGAAVLGAHAGPGTFCLFALPDSPEGE